MFAEKQYADLITPKAEVRQDGAVQVTDRDC